MRAALVFRSGLIALHVILSAPLAGAQTTQATAPPEPIEDPAAPAAKQAGAGDEPAKESTAAAPPPAPAPAAPAEAGKATSPRPDERKLGLGGDALFVIPVGDLANVTGILLGPVVRVGYRVHPLLELTGRTGFLFGTEARRNEFSSDERGLHIFPLWVGARAFFSKQAAPAGVYGAAEVGMNYLLARQSYGSPTGGSDMFPNASTEDSSYGTRVEGQAGLGVNLGLGYVVDRELPIDVRAQLQFVDLSEGAPYGIGLSAGYSASL